MDALVMWTNGTKNVVSFTKVKMLYKKRWYYGTILMLDDSQCEDISSDDEQVLADFLPLSRFNNYKDDSKKMKRNAIEIMKKCTPLDSTIESDVDDSDLDPDHKELCEIKKFTSVGENTCLCGLLLCVCAVFYKRRLAAFNLTIYDLATKDCHCFLWNETISKRGSCEISSCLLKML